VLAGVVVAVRLHPGEIVGLHLLVRAVEIRREQRGERGADGDVAGGERGRKRDRDRCHCGNGETVGRLTNGFCLHAISLLWFVNGGISVLAAVVTRDFPDFSEFHFWARIFKAHS